MSTDLPSFLTQTGRSRWRSCVAWPSDTIAGSADQISRDEHITKEQAWGAIYLLRREGFGGRGQIFPRAAWVEEIKP